MEKETAIRVLESMQRKIEKGELKESPSIFEDVIKKEYLEALSIAIKSIKEYNELFEDYFSYF